MSKRINISFKETERDTKLLLEVLNKHDRSAFIKECIEFYLKYKDKVYKLK